MEERKYMTLRELKEVTGSTEGLEVPTKRRLMETGDPIEVFISEAMPEYGIAAYRNGFALAISGKRYTVVRIDECRDYIYTHPDSTLDAPEYIKPQLIAEAEFLDQPWPVRIMLTVDDQFQTNEDSMERDWISKHPEIPDDKNWMCGSYDSFEDEVIAKIDRERMLDQLTDKQREVFHLYYEEGYTQMEIGKKLGITQEAVMKRLEGGIRKIRKLTDAK